MTIERPKPDASDSAPRAEETLRDDAKARNRAFFAQRLSLPPEEVEGATPSEGDPSEGRLPKDFRASLVGEYRGRVQDHLARTSPERLNVAPAPRLSARVRTARLASPATPGGFNWVPLGPSVGLNGNFPARTPISGRARGIAVSADGQRVYVASANGGVWRSDDGGMTFYSLMNAFDQAPTANKSDSLACGAVVIDPDRPDRLYVGTGEANGVGDMYFGVGVVSSTDGGMSFTTEVMKNPTEVVSGSGFFGMVMDPLDPELAFGAADQGLFRRQPRNQDVPNLPKKKPQSYMIRMDTTNGNASDVYWSEEGIATPVVWQSAGAWNNADVAHTQFAPYLYQGQTRFVRYVPGVTPNNAFIYAISTGGEPTQVGATATWTQAMLVMTFMMGGSAYLVRYDTSVIVLNNTTLSRIGADGALTDVWLNQAWGTWSALVPFTMHGVPFFIRYNTALALNNAEIMQWTGALTATRVGGAAFTLPQAAQIVPFEVNEEPFFLTYEPANNGQTTVFRLPLGGLPVQLWQRNAFPAAGTLTSFLWNGEPRLLVYVAGTTSLYGWGPGPTPVLIWTQSWDANLTFMPFLMGYEWVYDKKQFNPIPTGQANPQKNFIVEPARATSVVVARRSKDPVYYAAFWGRGQVYRSTDRGDTWALFGELPQNQGRIALGVAPSNPNVVYAFTEVGSVFRYQLDGAPGLDRWNRVAGTPPPPDLTGTQGSYDLVITVDPNNEDRIYLAAQGKIVLANQNFGYGAAIYRCDVTVSWTDGTPSAVPAVSMTHAYLGASVHADVHALTFTPGQSNALWVGCDGGVFYTDKANDSRAGSYDAMFAARNTGLSTMTVNDLAQQESTTAYDAVLLIANQDNGNQLYTGSEAWARASDLGDSGRVVYRYNSAPANPQLQLLATYTYGTIARSVNGGQTFPMMASVPILKDAAGNPAEPCQFYAPLVTARGADYVVFGSGRPWVSADFGASWRSIPSNTPQDTVNFPWAITAMAAQGAIIYAGFADGKLFKYTTGGAPGARIDNIGAAPPFLNQITFADANPNQNPIPITSIAVSAADPNLIAVTLGGNLSANPNGWARVWLFTGTQWLLRSGGTTSAATRLMNVQHNTIVMDSVNPGHLYVGADIGVWRSTNWGQDWAPFGEGLPESPVLALSLVPPKQITAAGGGNVSNNTNLLRAVTHGRGIYERVLADPAPDARNRRSVFLVVRASLLDRGLYDVQDNILSPFNPTLAAANIRYYDGEDIKVSAPTNKVFPLPAGERVTYPMPAKITFAQFAELTDQSRALKANQPARVYVQVHNRGLWPGAPVRVTVLFSQAAGGPLPTLVQPLPGGYEATVQAGGLVSDVNWTTLSVAVIDELFAGSPAVISVDIPGTSLGGGNNYCVLVLVTAPQDQYTTATTVIETVVKAEPKAAMKYLVVT